MSTLGERLKTLREGAKKDQKDVADLLEVDVGTVSRWERDKGYPHALHITKLARHFGVTTDHILLGEPVEEQVRSLEFHRFLGTASGRWAQEHGLVKMLLSIDYPIPPTVKTYQTIVTAWRVSQEQAEDEHDDTDPAKKP